MAMIVVLVLLSVLLMGALALARLTEVGTLAAGNASYREASIQASAVGMNTAYLAVRDITNEDQSITGWYWSTMQAAEGDDISNLNFDSAPELLVGNYRVRYVVDRLCNNAPVTNTLQQCLVKQIPQTESSKAGGESVDPPNARQFRVTVRVTGPKNTQTWTQGLVTKG
jgi:hypothetical protein